MAGKSSKTIHIVLTCLTGLFFLFLIAGVIQTLLSGNGFLFIPSVTPTQTQTLTLTARPTETATLTATITSSMTPTSTASQTVTPSITPSLTMIPSATFDIAAYKQQYQAELTQTAAVEALLMVPTATPVIHDNALTSGLKMENTTDGSTLVYIRQNSTSAPVGYGFWIDQKEITSQQYRKCIDQAVCSEPMSQKCGKGQNCNRELPDTPVINVSRDQAIRYCHWSGMELMTRSAWQDAVQYVKPDPDQVICGCEMASQQKNIRNTTAIIDDLWGNVWEWLADDVNDNALLAGGSWRTAKADIGKRLYAQLPENEFADDVGFRCIRFVNP